MPENALVQPAYRNQLDLDVGTWSAHLQLGQGWGPDEVELEGRHPRTTRWSQGEMSTIAFEIAIENEPCLLEVVGRGHPSLVPLEVGVLLGERHLGTLTFGADWSAERLVVPPDGLALGSNRLSLRYPETRVQGNQQVALQVDHVWLRKLPGEAYWVGPGPWTEVVPEGHRPVSLGRFNLPVKPTQGADYMLLLAGSSRSRGGYKTAELEVSLNGQSLALLPAGGRRWRNWIPVPSALLGAGDQVVEVTHTQGAPSRLRQSSLLPLSESWSADVGSPEARGFLFVGFHENEEQDRKTIVWCSARGCRFEVPLDPLPGDYRLVFEARVPRPRSVLVKVNDSSAGAIAFEDTRFKEYELLLPSDLLKAGINNLDFHVADTLSPEERQIGLAFDWLRLEPAAAEPGVPETEAPPRQGTAPVPGNVPPSLLVITLDTLRADHLGCYGYFRDTSPNLDALARDSVVFDYAVTPLSVTFPAHVSLFTSTLPTAHGIARNGPRFQSRAGFRTLPEMLRRQGYWTGAFVSATPVKSRYGLDTGFDTYLEPGQVPDVPAEVTAEKVINWLESEAHLPLFAWIHLFDPHAPYSPPPPFDELYKTDEALLSNLEARGIPNPTMERTKPNAHWRAWDDGFEPVAPTTVTNLYDGEVRYLDREMGRLMDELKRLGLYDALTIVVVGDHGEGLWQHEWLAHEVIWNAQLMVPLIIKFPAEAGLAGKRIKHPVSLVDIIPTLDQVLELPLTSDDRAQWRGEAGLDTRAGRHVVALRGSHREGALFSEVAILDAQWKLWQDLASPDGDRRLHNMLTDLHEQRDESSAHPEVIERLAGIAAEELAGIEGQSMSLEEVEDQQLKDELEALGYIDG